MDCSQMSYRGSLQHLATVARSLKSSAYSTLCKANKFPTPQRDTSKPFIAPPLFLQEAKPITSTLISAGYPPPTALSLSDAFLHAADQIRTAYQSTYSQTCKQLIHDTVLNHEALQGQLSKLGEALERQYRDRITAAEKLALSRAQNMPQVLSPKLKPIFNQEFTPLLEKYFEYNAYPSAPDRVALARKSLMTPRQIEVWFQNHRNRAKKEGMTLRRLSSDSLPLKLSLESLETMLSTIIPKGDLEVPKRLKPIEIKPHDKEISSDNHIESVPAKTSDFCFMTSPYAFPTVYSNKHQSSISTYNASKHTFPPPIWMRVPSAFPVHKQTLNIDELITEFATKLAITDSARNPQHSSVTQGGVGPWFAATHTIPSSAPHPAFIRQRPPVSSQQCSLKRIRATSAPYPHSHICGLLSPELKMMDFTSLSPSEGPGRKKIRHLPRRTPKSTNLGCRSTSSAISDVPPPSRSFSSGFRASSLPVNFYGDR